jgi:E3 ubiquitin-protein ligase MYCBP2
MIIEGHVMFEMVKQLTSFHWLLLCYSYHSNERLFLKDFVHCVPGTSGGRLSRWLQPDSYVDPARCEVLYSRDDMRCGWPAIVTVVTKDQYGDVVHVPNLKVGGT